MLIILVMYIGRIVGYGLVFLITRSGSEKCAKEKYLDLKILEADQGSLIVFVCSVLDRLFVDVCGCL